jgi:hypothetical protein
VATNAFCSKPNVAFVAEPKRILFFQPGPENPSAFNPGMGTMNGHHCTWYSALDQKKMALAKMLFPSMYCMHHISLLWSRTKIGLGQNKTRK